MGNNTPLTTGQLKEFLDSVNPTISQLEFERERKSFRMLRLNELPYIYNLNHLADLCNISANQLSLFVTDKKKAYVSFKIPKKNGTFREIHAPCFQLKWVQRWILDEILYNLDPGDYSHGFVPGRSIITNASGHVGEDLVLNIDLKDFFPNIKTNRIVGLFNKMGYTKKTAVLLAEICTFQWALPQGAPTSPMLSNLIAWHLDVNLADFCEQRGLNYSRYADDITISGPRNLPKYKTLIFRHIEFEGFTINYEKVRLHDQGSSQRVTGLVVNEKVSIERNKKKFLRAIVYNILKNGPLTENRANDIFFKERILGLLGFARTVDPKFADPLLEKLKTVNWDEIKPKIDIPIERELDLRLLKESHNNLVSFDQLQVFEKVCKLSDVNWDEKLFAHLEKLKEKCPDQSDDECLDCLHKKNKNAKYCIKHLLGFFIGNTCGSHHGHEVSDLFSITKIKDHTVFVTFIAKSGKLTRGEKDKLLRQVFRNTEHEDINVISIVSNTNLDTQSILDIIRIIKKCGEKQMCCLIMRNEMGQILVTYIDQN